MVTSDEDLTALVKRNSNKWDLRSMDKRDAWLIRADEKFSSDPEAYYAIANGPVTLEKVRAVPARHTATERLHIYLQQWPLGCENTSGASVQLVWKP